MNLFFYPDDSEILETCISISSFKYFRVIRREKQIHPFVFWKLWLDNFVSRSTDLYATGSSNINSPQVAYEYTALPFLAITEEG